MHQAFRRIAVQPQAASRLETVTFPAPTRGIVQDQNEAFMMPGSAVICDNWKPTLKGLSLRGGCVLHADLHALDKNEALWDFAGWDMALWDHVANSPPTRKPVISGFSYQSAINERMFAANKDRLVDVTAFYTDSDPILVRQGHTSGNYVASQMSNQGGDWLLAANETGDPLLRFNGTTWEVLDPGYVPPTDNPPVITGPAGSNVEFGGNLSYVCKYRNRYFFIEANSMNAWYLPLNAIGGILQMIPLSGAATRGGKLLFAANWSLDAGDGIDDKLVFCTDLGELLIFTGSDPSSAASWRQEGRYQIPPPLGMNAHLLVGGELLIATVDGIVQTSGAITKSREELELTAITRSIRRMWREEVAAKRDWSWTMCNWEEYGGIFLTTPGSDPGYCLVVNASTGAWARFVGYDATCFIRTGDSLFFGTQDGRIMQADRTGYDDGKPYTAVLVGGWEVFQSPAQTITWRQARASFAASSNQPFQPQLSGTTDYVVTLPPPPSAGLDPGPIDVWDECDWDAGRWDQPSRRYPVVRNTMWVSIGITGFSHAPVVQVTVAQKVKPVVDLIAISATFERGGINV